MKKMTVCSNCGAKFDNTLPKCPYCNAIYEPGAEQEYMEDLAELKEDLSELGQVPETTYKKEISKHIKKIVIIVIVVGIVLVLFWGIGQLFKSIFDAGYSEVELREQLLWEKDNFPILDKLYAEGDYEAILDIEMQAYDDGYSTMGWEHAYFLSAYRGYSYCMKRHEDLTSKENEDEDFAKYMVGEVMRLLFFLDEFMYSEEEWQIIQSWRPDLEEILYQDMKFTQEEALELYEKMDKDGIMDYDECDKYTRKIWKRFAE